MSKLVKRITRKFYPGERRIWPDDIFRNRITNVLREDYHILDYGAGRGAKKSSDFRGIGRHVCGVDINSAVLGNPQLDEAKVLLDGIIPYADWTFDVVYSRYVWEHLEFPERAFKEVYRVLKPGGLYLTTTPNRLHYVPVIASISPHWFHEYISEKLGGQSQDVFPTFYRVNTRNAVRRYARRAGFNVREIAVYEGHPVYLTFSAPTYLVGLVYERLVNSTACLEGFRSCMMVTLEKPRRSHESPGTTPEANEKVESVR